MTRLILDPRLPDDMPNLLRQLSRIFVSVNSQINGLTEGRIEADHSSVTAAPTTGDWYQGDKLRNSAPTELGSPGSKYVVTGWICTASGTPGTWLEMRSLTGN